MIRHLILVIAFVATPALACSPPLPDTRSPEQVTADIRRQFDQATDLVQVRMVRTATPRRAGRAVIIQSLKHARRPGSILRVGTAEGSMCGYGDAPLGGVHWLYLNNTTSVFFAPLHPDTKATLVRLNILPAG